MSNLLALPAYNLAILYSLLYFFWLLRENRAIMFWLYLWQLKEYHLGRFLAHFSTSAGKSIFFNGFFALKIVLLVLAALFYAAVPSRTIGANFFSLAFSIYYSRYLNIAFFASFLVFLIFTAETIWAAYSFWKGRTIRPAITKKIILLIVIIHAVVFFAAIVLYLNILGEMSLADFAFAAFLLLLFDVLTPLLVGLAVLALQPFTIWEKNRIVARAKSIIGKRTDLTTIGITGSYGKSSTKDLLAGILSARYSVLKTQANQNTEVGVSQTIIDGLKPEHEIFVCEIGAVHKGRIKQVGEAIGPKIGILTGINQQHMAVFGSQKNIVDGKYEILEVLPENGTAILNWDSGMVRDSFGGKRTRIKAKKFIFCSTKEKKEVFASDIEVTIDNLSFSVEAAGKKIRVETNARGRHMIEPILLAIAGATEAGMSLEEIKKAIEIMDFSGQGIKRAEGINGATVLESCYSANPDGVLAHLDYLKMLSQKKAIVMPSLIELGKSSKEIHSKIGKKIGETCGLAVIYSRDYFKEIKKGALESGMKKDQIVFLNNNKKIARLLSDNLVAGDVLLLEGRLPAGLMNLLKEEKSREH